MGPSHQSAGSLYESCSTEARLQDAIQDPGLMTIQGTQIGQCAWRVRHPNDQCSSLDEDAEESILALRSS